VGGLRDPAHLAAHRRQVEAPVMLWRDHQAMTIPERRQ